MYIGKNMKLKWLEKYAYFQIVGVQSLTKEVNSRLNDNGPFRVVSIVAILPELIIFLQYLFAVQESQLVIP